MNEPLFTAAPFYMMRHPIWPMEKLKEILACENWIEALLELYEKDELFREAISIASPTLYQSLQKKPLKDPFQTALSLMNYAIRMAARTIPFGLFTFVSTGGWGEKTENTLAGIYKKARPDMEWIYALIKKMYQDPSNLPVRANPLLVLKGSRLTLPFFREDINKKVNISQTALVEKIVKEARESITVSALMNKLHAAFPNLDAGKTRHVIQELLSNQILVPGLLPSLLKSFDLIPPEIAGEVEAYNQTPPGKRESQLAHLQKTMAAIAPAKTYLQVDSAAAALSSLPFNVKEELEKTVSFLWKLTAPQTQFSQIKAYHEKFLEKYGMARTVPLMDLFKELGSYSEHCTSFSNSTRNEWEKKWEKWLNNAWQECLITKKEEIVLDDQSMDSQPDPLQAMLSFDLFFKIAARSEEEIDRGEFSLIVTQTNGEAGSAFGRFTTLLGSGCEEKLRELHAGEELLDQNALFVELSYFPQYPRSANVAIHPCMREHALDLESPGLNLNDIYVGATLERFFLTLKSGGKEIHGCIGNLMTTLTAPEPIRFIRDVTLAKKKIVSAFSWGPLSETALYLPRVRYRKAILSPAMWKINLKNEPPDKIGELFTAWAERWNLPSVFLWVRGGDQQLLMDRNHPANFHDIVAQLKKGETLQFLESIDGCWMKREGGRSSPEMVLPFTKNHKFALPSPLALPHERVSVAQRRKLPGSEWLYLKFYLDPEGRERFLLQQLAPLAEKLRSEGVISAWFFLHYRDPEPHLRFRLRLASPHSLLTVMTVIENCTKRWNEEGLIKNMVIAEYEREIERYGGPELIEAAEEVFFADSLAVVSQLHLSKKHHPEAVFQPLSLICFLRDFGFNFEECVRFLDYPGLDKSELKGFREHKQKLTGLIEQLGESAALRKEKMARLAPLASVSIIRSLAHMHCNRLGCNANEEQRANLYALHALMALQRKIVDKKN